MSARTTTPEDAAMPVPAPTPTPAPTSGQGASAAGPRRRRRWWRWVLPPVLLVLGLVLLAGVGQASLRQGAADDPRGTSATGMGILARLLANHHVTVDVVDGQDRVPSNLKGTTVVVAHPAAIQRADVDRWARAGATRVVLLTSTSNDTAKLGTRMSGAYSGEVRPATPACDEHAATRMGLVTSRGPWLQPDGTWRSCATNPSGSAWVQSRTASGAPLDVVASSILNNRGIVEEGNAALGLNLLGHDPRVVWVMANSEPAAAKPGSDKPLTLVPNGLGWAVAVSPLLLAVVAVWRGRRFGPILSERLPVVVPASETVRGHGRLYARLRARDTAAASLRAASIRRLSHLLGAEDAARLAELLAVRTGGSARDIHDVLAGPTPADDVALIHLKQDLDRLEQEARKL